MSVCTVYETNKNRKLQLQFNGLQRDNIEGFLPEWCILTISHCKDIPFWSETLDMCDSPHAMSRNVPSFCHIFTFSESKSYAIYNGGNHFQIRGLVAELHAFKYGGMTFGTFGKTCFKC